MAARIARMGAIALSLGIVTSLVSPGEALAHDSVIKATPEDGGIVEEFPRDIVLTFSGIPRDTFNTVAVSDSDSGEVLFSQEPKLDGQRVSVEVPQDVHPGSGNYTVGFQITSSDGHATRGKTTFSVAGHGQATAEQPSENAQDGGSSPISGPLAWVVGGLGVLAMAAVVVLAVARNRRF